MVKYKYYIKKSGNTEFLNQRQTTFSTIQNCNYGLLTEIK